QQVNNGMQSLKSAFTTKLADQKAKDLKEAERALTQAVTTGKQDKSPAAWYYLGRYYLMVQDGAGVDSAFAKALVLEPKFKEDPDITLKPTDAATSHTDSVMYATRLDSPAKYFRLAVPAASDPKYAKDRPHAFLNVAPVYHSAKRYPEADAAYREFLGAYPND